MYREATRSQCSDSLAGRLSGTASRRAGRTILSGIDGPTGVAAPDARRPPQPRGGAGTTTTAVWAPASPDHRPSPAPIEVLSDDAAMTGVRWKGFLVACVAAPGPDRAIPGAVLARRWGAGRWPAASW